MSTNRRGFLKSIVATPVLGSVAVTQKPELPRQGTIEDNQLRPGSQITLNYRGMVFVGVVTEVRYDRPAGNLIRQRVEAERWIASKTVTGDIHIDADTLEYVDWHRSYDIESIRFSRYIPVASS